MISLFCAALALASTTGQTQHPIHREDIEWCDIWLPNVNKSDLPHVLLIGDSISRGYYDGVCRELAGRAYVDRLSTSAAAGDPALSIQVKSVLSQYRYSVIHINNGLHGWANDEAAYKKGVESLIKLVRSEAHYAKLIWATTTPVRSGSGLSPLTDRVRARNRISAELMGKVGIPIDDLFSIVIDHPEYSSSDGVHFNADGYTVTAKQVAVWISKSLEPAHP